MRFTDIHCHILPFLDDGAYSEDDFLNMAEVAEESGTDTVICTSHAYPGCDYTPEEYADVFRDMKERLVRFGIDVKLYPGQEIFVGGDAEEISEGIKSGRLFTLNDSVYPLIEFDFGEVPEAVFRAVRVLKADGFTPVIAHPERYDFLADSPDEAERLHRAGALLQLNAGSIGGFFGPDAEYTARYLLGERLADFVASDAHSPYVRTPVLTDAHEWVSDFCSPRYADYLFTENPQKIIKNEIIRPYRSAR